MLKETSPSWRWWELPCVLLSWCGKSDNYQMCSAGICLKCVVLLQVLKFVVLPRYVGKVWIKRRSLLEGLENSKLLKKKPSLSLQLIWQVGYFSFETCFKILERYTFQEGRGRVYCSLCVICFFICCMYQGYAFKCWIAITLSGFCDVMMSQGHLMTAVSKKWPLPSVQCILHFSFGGYLHGKKNTPKRISQFIISNCHVAVISATLIMFIKLTDMCPLEFFCGF